MNKAVLCQLRFYSYHAIIARYDKNITAYFILANWSDMLFILGEQFKNCKIYKK